MPTPDDIRALVTDYMNAMSSNDKDGYVALFAADASVEDPVGAAVVNGHAEIAQFWDDVHLLSETIRSPEQQASNKNPSLAPGTSP